MLTRPIRIGCLFAVTLIAGRLVERIPAGALPSSTVSSTASASETLNAEALSLLPQFFRRLVFRKTGWWIRKRMKSEQSLSQLAGSPAKVSFSWEGGRPDLAVHIEEFFTRSDNDALKRSLEGSGVLLDLTGRRIELRIVHRRMATRAEVCLVSYAIEGKGQPVLGRFALLVAMSPRKNEELGREYEVLRELARSRPWLAGSVVPVFFAGNVATGNGEELFAFTDRWLDVEEINFAEDPDNLGYAMPVLYAGKEGIRSLLPGSAPDVMRQILRIFFLSLEERTGEALSIQRPNAGPFTLETTPAPSAPRVWLVGGDGLEKPGLWKEATGAADHYVDLILSLVDQRVLDRSAIQSPSDLISLEDRAGLGGEAMLPVLSLFQPNQVLAALWKALQDRGGRTSNEAAAMYEQILDRLELALSLSPGSRRKYRGLSWDLIEQQRLLVRAA